jgi:phage FluMu gp28-like protein
MSVRRKLTKPAASRPLAPAAPATPQIHVPLKPLDILLPYQRDWATDGSRWKLGLMARQTGKDFGSGAEGAADCWRHELGREKTTWLIAAPSERQSLESLEKWKEWAEAFKLSIAHATEERTGGSESLLKSASIVFPNGSRVIAVPGKPDTVRGFSANLLLTEFAFFEDADRTWRAILPSITNPLRGGPKKVRIISTPNGAGNKFHDLWVKNHGVAGAKWSTHKVTIHDAIAQGLPVDLEELREGLDDPEGFAQEYDCEFLDACGVLLGYDLIALCESVEASEVIAPEWWTSRTPFPVDLGIDFGRKRDLTCCWALESIADLRMTKEVLTLQNMSTPDQVDILKARVMKARHVTLDYTGPGVGLGDLLVKMFGEWRPEDHRYGKIELRTASNSFNVEMFGRLRIGFERRELRIPISRVIREDLHSVYRVATKTSVSYRAPHTADGHADRCYALGLAYHSASGVNNSAIVSTEGIRVGGGRAGRPLFTPRRFKP